jgi:hypothetical protein
MGISVGTDGTAGVGKVGYGETWAKGTIGIRHVIGVAANFAGVRQVSIGVDIAEVPDLFVSPSKGVAVERDIEHAGAGIAATDKMLGP